MVTNDVIARTGEVPTGKNYLSGLIEVMKADPLFTEVRDRSNANFLWFIKFERSFRETEGDLDQKLQGIPSVPAGNTAAQQNPGPHAINATIIPFKGKMRRKAGAKHRATGTDDMATVYYIDHFLTLSNR